MSAKGLLGLVGTGFIVLLLLIGSFTFIERVPEGQVAVVYSPSGGAKKVLSPGWNMVGLFEKTTKYPTRITIIKDKVTVTTKDGKSVEMPVSFEYKVSSDKVLNIFKELGSQDVKQIQEGYMYQKLFRAARSVVSNYSVLEIYGSQTTEASTKITEKMSEDVEGLGFIITNVTLGTPKLDVDTEQAINARVQSAQELELKKQQLENEKLEAEKKKVVAEGEAQKKIIEAQATADAALLQATAQAEANRLLSDSLTENVLKRMELEARQKFGWITIQGGTPLVSTDGK